MKEKLAIIISLLAILFVSCSSADSNDYDKNECEDPALTEITAASTSPDTAIITSKEEVMEILKNDNNSFSLADIIGVSD